MNEIDLVSDDAVSDDDHVFAPQSALGKRPGAQSSLRIGGKSMRKPKGSSDEAEVALDGDVAGGADHVASLRKLLTEHDTMTADLLALRKEKATNDAAIASLQTALEAKDKLLKKRETKKKASVVATATSSKTGPRDCLAQIVSDCYANLQSNINAAKNRNAPAGSTSAAASTTTSTQIVQKNLAHQYLTERLLDAQKDANGLVHWFFESSVPPQPFAPVWTQITDASVCSNLFTLGRTVTNGNGDAVDFQPIMGLSVKYEFNQHKYEVSVVSRPLPAPPPAPAAVSKWQEDVLSKGCYFKTTPSFLDKLLKQVDFDLPDAIEKGSQVVADLAALLSSAGQGFTYNVQECQLWIKPLWLKVWLTVAKTRKFSDARLLMHGMRSGEYQKLATDISGFDMSNSADGRHHYAFYGATSDHIPSDYHGGKHPPGSCYIGLLWVKAQAKEGAYTNYHLGSHKYPKNSIMTNSKHLDAYAVHDQLLWLPIGLAVANSAQ